MEEKEESGRTAWDVVHRILFGGELRGLLKFMTILILLAMASVSFLSFTDNLEVNYSGGNLSFRLGPDPAKEMEIERIKREEQQALKNLSLNKERANKIFNIVNGRWKVVHSRSGRKKSAYNECSFESIADYNFDFLKIDEIKMVIIGYLKINMKTSVDASSEFYEKKCFEASDSVDKKHAEFSIIYKVFFLYK